MQMIYDSDGFVVVHMDANAGVEGLSARDGFEIVDKRSNTSLYLDGRWAADFQALIKKWQADTPDQSEVEGVLDNYSQLAQYPLVMH